jgi:NAD(P)-dependent dehydrogenase (short-subunit alcohol dehydrogenase family)
MPNALLSFQLPDIVLVSGASSGLGHEVCGLLLAAGVRTIGVDVSPALPSLAAQAGYAHVAGDVATEDTWARAVAPIRTGTHASIGLVTSAAILDVGTVAEMTPTIVARAFAVNVLGTALAIKAVLPAMLERGGGAIVAVSSVNGTLAEQQLGLYNATKAAVRQLARTVAMDHARQGIRTNVLSPGPMMAGLFKRHLESAKDSERFLASRAARQPIGRILEAREVAQTALYLLSDGATALVGADVIADGGLTASFDFRTGAEGASV